MLLVIAFLFSELYRENYWYKNRKTVHDITGVMLPRFKEIKSTHIAEGLLYTTIEFKEALTESFYQKLDSVCKVDKHWDMYEDSTGISFHYHKLYDLPAPKRQSEDNDRGLSSIIIKKGSQTAAIRHIW